MAFGLKSANGKTTANAAGTDSSYQSVQIVPGLLGCCQAVRGTDGQRYLSGEAPRLPVPECDDPAACQCTYKRFKDRRDEPRRSADVGFDFAGQFCQDDLRDPLNRGRRNSD